MKARRAATALMLLACSSAGCRQTVPTTEIVIAVRTDLAIGTALSSVRAIAVEPPDGNVPGLQLVEWPCVALGDGPLRQRPPLLLAFGLEPNSTGHRVVARAIGYSDPNCTDGAQVVEQSATVTFVEHAILRLDLKLLAACVGVTCPASQTCAGPTGRCDSDVRDPLPAFDPATYDAGVDPLDGAPLPRDGAAGGDASPRG